MRELNLGKDKILPLLIKNSIPAILANIVFSFYNVVNKIFVGKGLGRDALAGLGIVFPIMTLIVGLEILISTGAGVLISIKLGEKQRFFAQKILGNMISVYSIFSLILFIFGFLLVDKMLILCGASEITLPYAKNYFLFLLPCFLFQFISMGLNNIIRAESNIKTAMGTILISTITNIILDPIFIFGLGLGVRGAAIATDFGMIFGTIWVLWHFRKNRHRVLSLHIRDLKIQKDIVFSIFSKGFSYFFMQITTTIITIILNNTLYKYGGNIAISAFGVINTIFFIVFMIIVGLNQGCQHVIGFNFGAKNYKRVFDVMIYSILLSFFITVPFFFYIQFFGKDIVSIFCVKGDTKLLELSVRGLKIIFSMLILSGFNITSINFFLSLGKSKLAFILNTIKQVILFIPALIIMPRFFGLDGIWNIYPVIEVIMFLIIFGFFYKEYRYFKKLLLEKKF